METQLGIPEALHEEMLEEMLQVIADRRNAEYAHLRQLDLDLGLGEHVAFRLARHFNKSDPTPFALQCKNGSSYAGRSLALGVRRAVKNHNFFARSRIRGYVQGRGVQLVRNPDDQALHEWSSMILVVEGRIDDNACVTINLGDIPLAGQYHFCI